METILKETEQLNSEQQKAVDKSINSFTKVVAGAGTGKTKIISKRYIKLVLDLQKQGIERPLEKILVITFTNKAANEMKERIYKELNKNKIDFYGQELNISTIHSFCLKLLKKHSIEVNLSPDFKTEEETTLIKIFQNIINKIRIGEYNQIKFIDEIAKELDIDKNILNSQNLIELKIVSSLDNIFDTIYKTIKKIKSLGLTPKEFLKNAIVDIKNFTQTVKEIPCLQFSETDKVEDCEEQYIHSWKEHFRNTIYSETIADSAIREIYSSFIKRGKTWKRPNTWQFSKELKSFLSSENDKNAFYKDINDAEIELAKLTAFIYGIYQKQLEDLDYVDFDDYINKSLYILKNNELIRSYYQKHFKHIIVDEFQDTNGAQLELLYNLMPDTNPNITIVGDKKQSIYGFRYAKMENMDILHNKILKKYPNYKDNEIEIKLINNYRSTEKVLNVVNSLTEKDLKLDENLQKGNQKLLEDNSKIKIQFLNKEIYSDKTLSQCIAKTILEKINEQNNKLTYKDFAVLLRTNQKADLIYEVLKENGIPSIKADNTSYFYQPTIKNIIAMFDFVQNIKNEQALIRILSIHFTEKEIYEIVKKINELFKLKNQTKSKENLSEKIIKLIVNEEIEEIEDKNNQEILKTIKSLYKQTFSIIENRKNISIIQIFYEMTKLIRPYSQLEDIEEKAAKKDIKIFEKIIIDYQKQFEYTGIKYFNEYIQEISEDKTFEIPTLSTKDINAVQLVTIHKSKGLEYPYVFVYNLSNKQISDTEAFDYEYNESKCNFGIVIKKYNNISSAKYEIYKKLYKEPQNREENKRVYYVALSRAKSYLDILGKYTVKKDGTTEITDYLKELSFFRQFPIINLENRESININKELINKNSMNSNIFEEKIDEEEENLEAPILPTKTNNKIILSFSKINTYKKCKRKFLIKHIYGYPEYFDKEKLSERYVTQKGRIIHNLIYNSYERKNELTEEEIDEILNNFEIEKSEIQEIKKLYNIYKNSTYATYREGSYAEYHIEYKTKENILIQGDIDLLMKNEDGSYTIIDYKTNRTMSKERIKEYTEQMNIYRAGKVKEMLLLNLTEEGIKAYKIEENKEEDITKNIKEIKNLINRKDIVIEKEEIKKENCKQCGYQYICKID
jgi:ATP-dependent helicase/nuclease subunit A